MKQVMRHKTSPQGDLRSLARGFYKRGIIEGFIEGFMEGFIRDLIEGFMEGFIEEGFIRGFIEGFWRRGSGRFQQTRNSLANPLSRGVTIKTKKKLHNVKTKFHIF